MQLLQVFPSSYYELLLVFSDHSCRLLKYKPNSALSFMGYPAELKALRSSAEGIEWKNGVRFTVDQLYELSAELSFEQQASVEFTIGSQNNAPTDQDERHHEYFVQVYPLNMQKPFQVGESIGGGHGERGGASALSLQQLLAWPPGWKEHFRRSGCAWAIGIVEEYADNIPVMMQELADFVFARAWRE